MKTVIKIFLFFAISLSLNSCMLTGVKGSRKVTSESRTFNQSYTGVKVSHGIDVKLTQADEVSFTAEMDDNLHDLLITEIENDVLKIYFEKNVRNCKSKTVYLSMPLLNKITTSSGAEVQSENTIKTDELSIDSSSGSEVNLQVEATILNVAASSGSDIDIKGSGNNLVVDASSGSTIDAEKFISKIVDANASSGADIEVFASESITAKASSGGKIDCDGNPQEKSIKKSSGGHVKVN
jgi:hypothetical protein